MMRSMGRSPFLVAGLAVLIPVAAASEVLAAREPLVPFAAAEMFIELNATDEDAGIQVFLDGEEWERLRIFDPNGRKILDISASGGLRELGLTELFFESGEPSPAEVLDLFPEGDYKFRGTTLEGELLVGKARLSHDFLEEPHFSPADGEVVDLNDTVITWDAVAGAVAYEVIVENEDLGVEMSVRVPASVRSLQVPPTFLTPNTEYDVEVLAISANGNKTISESNFMTRP